MRVASGLACGAARRGRLVLARNGTIWNRTAKSAPLDASALSPYLAGKSPRRPIDARPALGLGRCAL